MKGDRCPFEIIYQDEDILTVYKKRDVLSVKSDDPKTFRHNLYYYLKKDVIKKDEELYVLHRLDYETSGILVFPKKKEVHSLLQKAFQNRDVLREYEAVISEKINLHEAYEVHELLTDGKKVFSGAEGKEAITSFESMNYIQIGTALKIDIKTGRKNQIRLALHDSGFTLLGDRRYSDSNAKRMYLNHYHLVFPSYCGLKVSDFYMNPLWINV